MQRVLDSICLPCASRLSRLVCVTAAGEARWEGGAPVIASQALRGERGVRTAPRAPSRLKVWAY